MGLQHPGAAPNVAAARWDTAWGTVPELFHLFPQFSVGTGTVGQVGHRRKEHGVRPAEAVGLRKADCHLPEHGWGLLTLAETRPTSGRKYTDTGDVHDRRGLKQREREDVRPVPIPPDLVRILREHVETFGTADDGRLFRNERGGVLGSTTYTRAWQEARGLALTPQQVASPLAGTPYDLRHAALSTWLNGGVDATDVAERAGNSVEVLLKRYAKCLDGHQDRNNRLIERALQVDNEQGSGGRKDP